MISSESSCIMKGPARHPTRVCLVDRSTLIVRNHDIHWNVWCLVRWSHSHVRMRQMFSCRYVLDRKVALQQGAAYISQLSEWKVTCRRRFAIRNGAPLASKDVMCCCMTIVCLITSCQDVSEYDSDTSPPINVQPPFNIPQNGELPS
jgi:hypothetical protein